MHMPSQPKKTRRGFFATVFSGLAIAATAIWKGIKDNQGNLVVAAGVLLTFYIKGQQAYAATLETEKKLLEIEALKNGNKTTESKRLTADELSKILETKRVKIVLEDGTETELSVEVKK
jgi:hypothetical protein